MTNQGTELETDAELVREMELYQELKSHATQLEEAGAPERAKRMREAALVHLRKAKAIALESEMSR